MRALAEAAAFGGAALALHAGAFALWHPSPMPGGEGSASVAVAAASPEVAALAAAWDAAPEGVIDVARPEARPGRESEAVLPVSDAAPASREAPRALPEGAAEQPPAAVLPVPRVTVATLLSPPGSQAPIAGMRSMVPMSVAEPARGDLPIPMAIARPAADPALTVVPDLPLARPAADVSPTLEAAALPTPPDRSPPAAPAVRDVADLARSPVRDLPFSPDAPEELPTVASTAPPESDLAPPASLRPAAMPERPERVPERSAATSTAARTAASGGSGTTRTGTARGGAASISSGRSAASAPGPSAETLQAQWGAEVKGHIAGRAAPPRGVRGQVGLVVSVATDGRIAGVGVARSSGDVRADRAAAGAVQRVGRVPRAPGGLPAGTYRFTVALTLR